MIQQKKNFSFRKRSIFKSLFTGVIVFMFSLFLFNCSTPSNSFKKMETTMSSTPSRGLAGIVRIEKSCPKGFGNCTSSCDSAFTACCPLEYMHTLLLNSEGQLDCNIRPGYVRCDHSCCKIPKSYCTAGGDVLCPRNSLQARIRGETEKPDRPVYHEGMRLSDSVFFADNKGRLVPEGTRKYSVPDRFGDRAATVCKNGVWHQYCPEGQVSCGRFCCHDSSSDGGDGQGVSQ